MKQKIFAAALVTSGLIGLHGAPQAAAQQAMVQDASAIDGIVESVDLRDHKILLRVPDGLITVNTGPEVKNLRQVKAGDNVHVNLSEALVARVTEADPAATPVVESTLMTAKSGQRPGAVRRETGKANVRVTAIDTASNTVKFVGPSGQERMARIQDPAMKAMLHKIKVGDIVEVTYAVALAVAITPAGS
jgi:translation initiation factor IF-1